jgi:hypothetical protein
MKRESIIIPAKYKEPFLSLDGYTFTALIAQQERKFIIVQYYDAWCLLDAKNGHPYGTILGIDKNLSLSELRITLEKKSRELIDEINSVYKPDSLQSRIRASDENLFSNPELNHKQ